MEDSNFYVNLLNRSLISTGNNNRMLKSIKKAKAGDKVSMVFLGGSITMLQYPDITFRYYKDLFKTSDNITYINSGMNGTPSIVGLIRVERDVLIHKPDIVFIEFAVNDSKDSIHRIAFESLVRRILQHDSQPAVVLLFMNAESGYSCQGHMQVIGEFYRLPMISINDAVRHAINENRMVWSDYSDDSIHPNAYGNKLIADCIYHYFMTVADEHTNPEEPIPSDSLYGDIFTSMQLIDSSNALLKSLGGFHTADTIKEFQHGWVQSKNHNKEAFTMELNCRCLFVIYKETNDIKEGSALIYVDGIQKCILSGYRLFAWGNPAHKLVFQEEDVRKHIIEVKMLPGDEEKEFSLLAFGYCV